MSILDCRIKAITFILNKNLIDSRISILMPVHNAARFLVDCLDSILAQTEAGWELWAVDDFSTDDSQAILSRYAEADARIRVLTNTEKGIIPALQCAFAHSRGNWITRMDADDLMHPDKLSLLKAELLKVGPGHVSTGMVSYFSDAALGDGYRRYADWLNGLVRECRHAEDLYRECVIPSPSWMAYREDLLRCGAFGSLVYPEDYDLCFRFFQQGLKIAGVPEVLHYWRDSPGRASRNDPNYAGVHYFELKMPWFFKLHFDPDRPLALWGAGKKGKALARDLSARGIEFYWISNNPRKTGRLIYGKPILSVAAFFEIPDPQVIVAVAAPDGQREIDSLFTARGLLKGKDVFFFC